LAVEATGAQQRAVEHVGAIGGGDDDDALGGVEAVHLHEHGVEGLLAFVVAAAEAGAALTADGVDLVDEDDAGGVFAALLKHVAHAAGADADKHFHEVGAGDAEERDFGFARDGLGEQGLAGAGRADQEDALGDVAAHFLEALRVLEEVHDFGDLLLGLVATGDVGEKDAFALAGEELGLALAEAHGAATGVLDLAHEEEVEQADDQQEGQEVEEDLHAHVAGGLFLKELGRLELGEVGVGEAALGAEVLHDGLGRSGLAIRSAERRVGEEGT